MVGLYGWLHRKYSRRGGGGGGAVESPPTAPLGRASSANEETRTREAIEDCPPMLEFEAPRGAWGGEERGGWPMGGRAGDGNCL